jgi:hypothetical protein
MTQSGSSKRDLRTVESQLMPLVSEEHLDGITECASSLALLERLRPTTVDDDVSRVFSVGYGESCEIYTLPDVAVLNISLTVKTDTQKSPDSYFICHSFGIPGGSIVSLQKKRLNGFTS